jgi:putative membrane protein
MPPQVPDLETLQLSDQLAVERTILAMDRTLLAWVRTSVSLISFGFTVYKVLDAVQQANLVKFVKTHTPRNIGIFMILIGIVPLALAMFQYGRAAKRLRGKHTLYANTNLLTAGAVFLLGFMLLVMVVTHLDVF